MSMIAAAPLFVSTSIVGRMRQAWLCAFLPSLLLGLEQFLHTTGRGPVPKVVHVVAFMSGMVIFGSRADARELIRKPVLWWCIGYVVVSITWSTLSTHSEFTTQDLTHCAVTLMYVSLACVIFSQLPSSGSLLAILFWTSLLGGVASVVFDAIKPGTLVPHEVFAGSGVNISGRAAGFYLNPNIAAQAFVMLLAVIVAHSGRAAGSVAVIVSFIGIVLTFSRAGILAWFLVALSAIVSGRLPRKMGALAGALVIGVLVGLNGEIVDFMSRNLEGDWSAPISRVEFFAQGGKDTMRDERARLAEEAVGEILRSPFIGHGLGYSYYWGEAQDGNAHNIFLKYALDFGLLGLVLFPTFLVSLLLSGSRRLSRLEAATMLAVGGLLGVASHNLMEQPSFLLPLAALTVGAGALKRQAASVPQLSGPHEPPR